MAKETRLRKLEEHFSALDAPASTVFVDHDTGQVLAGDKVLEGDAANQAILKAHCVVRLLPDTGWRPTGPIERTSNDY